MFSRFRRGTRPAVNSHSKLSANSAVEQTEYCKLWHTLNDNKIKDKDGNNKHVFEYIIDYIASYEQKTLLKDIVNFRTKHINKLKTPQSANKSNPAEDSEKIKTAQANIKLATRYIILTYKKLELQNNTDPDPKIQELMKYIKTQYTPDITLDLLKEYDIPPAIQDSLATITEIIKDDYRLNTHTDYGILLALLNSTMINKKLSIIILHSIIQYDPCSLEYNIGKDGGINNNNIKTLYMMKDELRILVSLMQRKLTEFDSFIKSNSLDETGKNLDLIKLASKYIQSLYNKIRVICSDHEEHCNDTIYKPKHKPEPDATNINISDDNLYSKWLKLSEANSTIDNSIFKYISKNFDEFYNNKVSGFSEKDNANFVAVLKIISKFNPYGLVYSKTEDPKNNDSVNYNTILLRELYKLKDYLSKLSNLLNPDKKTIKETIKETNKESKSIIAKNNAPIQLSNYIEELLKSIDILCDNTLTNCDHIEHIKNILKIRLDLQLKPNEQYGAKLTLSKMREKLHTPILLPSGKINTIFKVMIDIYFKKNLKLKILLDKLSEIELNGENIATNSLVLMNAEFTVPTAKTKEPKEPYNIIDTMRDLVINISINKKPNVTGEIIPDMITQIIKALELELHADKVLLATNAATLCRDYIVRLDAQYMGQSNESEA